MTTDTTTVTNPALDAAVAAAAAGTTDDELKSITVSLHRIADTISGSAFATALAHLADAAATAPPADPRSLMTPAQEAALREAGSLNDAIPDFPERASTRTAITWAALLSDSLTTSEVARMLGVGTSRIRQRAAERSLYGVRRGTGWVFPAFQFVDGREMPGWDQVAPHIPPDEHLVAVHNLMTRPHADLTPEHGGEPLSPMRWLGGGGAVAPVIELVDGAFARYS